jgi:DNA-binding MarR family transcriptional regulator
MEDLRGLFQTMTRRFGILDKNCSSLGGIELSLVQSHILYEIDIQHNPSMQQIADTLAIDITTFSRQIQTLVQKCLVAKTPLPEDRRVTILSLTAQGKQVVTAINEQMNTHLKDMFSSMTEFEQDMVLRSIQLLNANMAKSSMCSTPLG